MGIELKKNGYFNIEGADFSQNMLNLILLGLLLSGILASARLKEKAHTKTQLYFGFFIGLFIEIFAMFNY